MKKIFYIIVLFLAWATKVPSIQAQTSPPLRGECIFGNFTVRGDPSYFSQWPLEFVAEFYFGPGDPRNGPHRASQPIGTNPMRVTFADIPCSNNRILDQTFVITVPTLSGDRRNYIFVDGDYCPTCKSLQKCPTSFSCNPLGFVTLQFDYTVPCLPPPLPSTPPDIRFYFGPGHPFNDFTYSSYSCTPGPPGTMSFGRGNIGCFGGCPNFAQLQTLTIDGEVCRYENGVLVTEPTCPNGPGQNGGGNSACGDFFENCLGEFNTFLVDNSSALACRQWKQQVARCDPDLWAGRTGRVGIGVSSPSGHVLSVKDGLITDKLRVQNCQGWCDYVFAPSYRLMPLGLLKDYIGAHGHLPNTPSAAEVEQSEGIALKETILNHQEKIEEVFLHLIALKKEADTLQVEYRRLLDENVLLKNK